MLRRYHHKEANVAPWSVYNSFCDYNCARIGPSYAHISFHYVYVCLSSIASGQTLSFSDMARLHHSSSLVRLLRVYTTKGCSKVFHRPFFQLRTILKIRESLSHTDVTNNYTTGQYSNVLDSTLRKCTKRSPHKLVKSITPEEFIVNATSYIL